VNEGTILLIDPSLSEGGSVLAGRLRAQGFSVVEQTDAEEGIRFALLAPPTVVVANLWMPKISGVQLCRLLGAEPVTRGTPVILRGPDGQRNRFWASKSGASDYVLLGRMGDLVRAIKSAVALRADSVALWEDTADPCGNVRDRIADYLDQALFDSVIAGEIRCLGTSTGFDRLFDLLSQLVSQITSYRWLAVATEAPARIAVHSPPGAADRVRRAACEALEASESSDCLVIEDHDALSEESGPPPIVRDIVLGSDRLGRVALAVRAPEHPRDAELVEVLARELAGPIRITALVEESRQLASIDPLTRLSNRRAFLHEVDAEVARAERHRRPLSFVLLDVDHFKSINDAHGHAGGDLVLAEIGRVLAQQARKGDVIARWGGEEFILALHSADLEGASIVAERLRTLFEGLSIVGPTGTPIPVTASFGVAQRGRGESIDAAIDRTDRAMYRSKTGGRNRVTSDESFFPEGPSPAPPSRKHCAARGAPTPLAGDADSWRPGVSDKPLRASALRESDPGESL
jgi:two-component system, cell cycle response regulator